MHSRSAGMLHASRCVVEDEVLVDVEVVLVLVELEHLPDMWWHKNGQLCSKILPMTVSSHTLESVPHPSGSSLPLHLPSVEVVVLVVVEVDVDVVSLHVRSFVFVGAVSCSSPAPHT